MVSDGPGRARFYGILDTAYVPRGAWREKCRALVAGGAGLVQLRMKREAPEERARLAAEVVELVPRGCLIINDDVALAASIPAAGLHVGQDDADPTEARAILGPGRVLGLSTHSVAQVSGALTLPAGVLSYFAVGPVYATATKPEYAAVGLELVRYVAGCRPDLPWFAIGGVRADRLEAVAEAGARRVVAVSEPLLAPDTAAVVSGYLRVLERWPAA